MAKAKNPAAVELGRRGGSKKVPKGTSALTPEERKERASAAAKARWAKAKAEQPQPAAKKAGKKKQGENA